MLDHAGVMRVAEAAAWFGCWPLSVYRPYENESKGENWRTFLLMRLLEYKVGKRLNNNPGENRSTYNLARP
jgi:hypothetical protein